MYQEKIQNKSITIYTVTDYVKSYRLKLEKKASKMQVYINGASGISYKVSFFLQVKYAIFCIHHV